MNLRNGIGLLLAGVGMVACNKEDIEPDGTLAVSAITKIETVGELVNEDYQGERNTYFYDWNGSYFNEFEYHIYNESLKEDGTCIFTEKNSYPAHNSYWEGAPTTYDNLIEAPEMLSSADLAVVDGSVYMVGVNSTFFEERKLYVYQLVGDHFEAKDSVTIDIEGTVEEFAMEAESGVLLISVVQNALKTYGHSNLRHVYRYVDGKLSLLKSYPNKTEGATFKLIPFKGGYLEYHQEGRTISQVDESGQTTVLIDGKDLSLDTPEHTVRWQQMHFSKDLIMICVENERGEDRQVSTVLVYDGTKLYQVYMPAFFNDNGVAIHTLFSKGNHYIHYDAGTRMIDVYFHGEAWINYSYFPRVYHYQVSLGD